MCYVIGLIQNQFSTRTTTNKELAISLHDEKKKSNNNIMIYL
jgi:hypothetical protein